MQEIRRAYNARVNSGGEDWETLDPLVERARRCFGAARTRAHAELLAYETWILVRQQRFAEAETVFDRFFAGFAAVAARDVVARMHMRRGHTFERLGRTAAMLEEYAQAAAMVDELPPRDAALALDDAGTQYRRVGDLYTAQRFLLAADSIFSALYVNDPEGIGPELGRVRMHRAAIFLDEAKLGSRTEAEAAARAAPFLDDALRLIPARPGSAFYRIQALRWTAQMHWFRNDPEAALAPLAEALRLSPWEAASPQLIAWVWQGEGETRRRIGDYAAARDAFATALRVSQDGGYTIGEMGAQMGLGQVEEAMAADAAGLQRAEAHFREAVALAEARRATFGTHDWSASAWEETQEPYLHLTRVLLRQGRAEEAFTALDATRARYLRDRRKLARLRSQLDTTTIAQLDSLATQLRETRYQLGGGNLTPKRFSVLNQNVITLAGEIEALTGFYETDPDSLDVPALQRTLGRRGQVLLSYFFEGDISFVFVVRPDTLVVVELPASEATLRQDLAAVSGLWKPDGDLGVLFDLRPLKRLHDALFAPVRSLIPEGFDLVIIPDGVMAQFPFGLLLEEDHPPYDYTTAPYLLRNYVITVELAAGLMLDVPAPIERPLSMLALGRSRFGDFRSRNVLDRNSPVLPDLPSVEEELRQIQRRIGGLSALNEQATEAFLYQHLGEARLIHLASHSFVDPILPLYSHVELWDGPDDDNDGTLYLYELQGHALAADLVVLSGCSTARGLARSGEGMMGLQYAFRAAGARSVLATLWQVEDRATVDLMDQFYLNLSQGLSRGDALRQAQLTYLSQNDGRKASPFFWAAPVLYGDVSPIALKAQAPSAIVWILVGVLLVLSGLALPHFLRRRSAHG